MNKNLTTAKECAKDMIRSYVLRGDSIEQLAGGKLGVCGEDYSACIGGVIYNNFGTTQQQRLTLKTYEIGVDRVGKVEILQSFSLKDLYFEILNEKKYGKQIPLDI